MLFQQNLTLTSKEKRLTRDICGIIKKTDFREFKQNVAITDFESCFEHGNVDNISSMWTESFLNVARSTIPNKVVTIRPDDVPWYTSRLRHMKREVKQAYLMVKRSVNNDHFERFRDKFKK